MGLDIPSPLAWAQRHFGAVKLRDRRRTRRAVQIAARMMGNPAASLPTQMRTASALKAAYRLLAQKDASYQALLTPHWEQTRQAARQEPQVLLIQDTTQLDYTHHPTTEGLGPVGDGHGRGLHLHTALAVVPAPRQVLGIAYQEPFLRQPAPAGQDSKSRRRRPRESQVWTRAVRAIGPPPAGGQWMHVGDAYADIYEFMVACRQEKCHFLIRVAQDRRIQDETCARLFALIAALPAQGTGTLDLPARAPRTKRIIEVSASKKRPARQAQVQISFGATTILPPAGSSFAEPLPVWVVRVWELDPPPEVPEPVDWRLLTSLPITTLDAAWELTPWYKCRWLAEDYHQCLKTGCSIEKRQLQEGERLIRLLGFLAPVAVRLLQLRELARLAPERLATEALPRDLVHLVATLAEVPPATLTVARFWRAVAGLGGYLGRRRDGPPGWKTLWRGWLYVQTLLEGVHLASRLPP